MGDKHLIPHSGFSACAHLRLHDYCVYSYLSDIWLCVSVCVPLRIYSFALVTELRSEETSFLNSAGIVELNYIKEGSSNPGFHGTQAFRPLIQYSCMHSCQTLAHAYTHRIVTLGSHECGQNMIALSSSFWLWADHTSLSYIQYSTYINLTILNGLLNYLWDRKI